ncbi:heat inducible transcription repressor HrcA [Mycoplasmopsis maculosa]|uniref:Heat-inducible transcription repressor HrcA n=1 Tax=Mycoplasmopsis maculosa TaxID=114885 RepID=A0A449B459_9BACT|nr:heat-inducible transcriptional repressor HrcA [Mycoplasmopsis maculosa]VEU75328.1 heat inducible transcription repressor HrcA [Mycoplasmopsis maculosa]
MKNKNEVLTEDLKFVLKNIVEIYIETGYPVSSLELTKRNLIDFSSAKARYLLNELENLGYLEKTHTSSGRIPSTKGYEYYAKNLAIDENESIKERIKDIFAKRRMNIDQTINEVAKIITDSVGATLVITESNEGTLLKHLQLVPLNDQDATIILVNSDGEVSSRTINLDTSKVSMNDLKIAIRIFKERLIDVPLVKLGEMAVALKPILSLKIKNYEDLLEDFINGIFIFKFVNKNNIHGKSNIILADEISREDLNKILYTIENKSIWETIEAETEEDENIKIAIRDDHSSYISTKISSSKIKEISLVGSNRMDYSKALKALEAFNEVFKNNKD